MNTRLAILINALGHDGDVYQVEKISMLRTPESEKILKSGIDEDLVIFESNDGGIVGLGDGFVIELYP